MQSNTMYKTFILVVLCSISGSYSAIASNENNDDNFNSINRGAEARNMLSSLASSIMSRNFVGQPNGSQVVSLNLTNLFVLVLLKALIFAAGSIGAGTWKGGLARSLDGEDKFLTEDEILLYLSYLTGQDGCLQSVACRDPLQAKKYAAAGDMLLKASKMLFVSDVRADRDSTQNRSYDSMLRGLREAVAVGINGGDCARYSCGVDQSARRK